MRARLLVVAICAALAAALLFSRGVWAPDEARYAEVAREMKAGGTWLVPVLNGETYTQKPPLFFGLIRLFAAGSDAVPEWAAKAPSLLGALATLWVLGWLAQRLVGGSAGWLAPLLLGTMGKFAWQSQFGQIDMIVTALVVAQVALGLLLAQGGCRRLPGLAGMVALGFAGVLGKGPVACLLPWLVLLLYLCLLKEWAGLRRVGLPWVIAGVCLLAAVWLAAAGVEAGWAYPQSLVMRQTVQRYLDPWHHRAPWYYYFGVLLSDGLPYSLLLVPLAFGLRKAGKWREPGVLLPLCWAFVYLAVFSVSAAKRSVYILPVYPAMALLLAWGAEAWRKKELPQRGFRWALLVLASLWGAGILYAILKVPGEFRGFLPWLLAGGGLAFAGALVAALLAAKPRAALVSTAAGMALFLLVAAVPGVRRMDEVKSPRAFVRSASAALASGGALGVFPSLVPSVNYYLGAVTPVFAEGREADAAASLAADARNLLLVQPREWKGPVPPHETVVRGAIGGQAFEIWAAPREGGAP